MLKSDYTLQHRPRSEDKKYTIEDVKAEWGEPKQITLSDNKTTLFYSKGLRWKGIIIIPLIPIPLAIPVGFKTVSFEFTNNELDRWKIHGTHYCFSYAGFNFIPVIPVGFFAESDCQSHDDMLIGYGEMSCNVPFYDKCYPSTGGARGTGNSLK